MSDVMFYGVLRMPYEMAMEGEISRLQFYGRAQQAADRVERAEARIADLEREVEKLARMEAAERLRADQGWQRYESANADRNALRADMAATPYSTAVEQASIGEAVAMPGSGGGFTICVFNAADVPVGASLYSAPLEVQQDTDKEQA